MIKLTKKQLEKVQTIKAYLNDDTDGNGLLISCDATQIYSVKNIYINASGIWLTGKCYLFKKQKDNVHPSGMNAIYRACLKDEDFNNWLDKRN